MRASLHFARYGKAASSCDAMTREVSNGELDADRALAPRWENSTGFHLIRVIAGVTIQCDNYRFANIYEN